VEIQLAAIGTAQRLADPPWQVDVRRPHHDRVVPFLDLHDPVQGVLGLFLLFLMAREVGDLVLVAHSEVASDRQLAGRTVVVDPVTCLAELLMAGAPSANVPRETPRRTADTLWAPAA
jgi:hypothetical protein